MTLDESAWPITVSTGFACHRFFLYRSAFLGLWVKLRKLTTAEIQGWENKRRIITSLVWFFSSLGLAIVVPTIGKAIAIVGGFAAHFIFTFPGGLVWLFSGSIPNL
jgi:hypothetical protein